MITRFGAFAPTRRILMLALASSYVPRAPSRAKMLAAGEREQA